MMSISSLFLCRVGGRAGDDDVDAKGLSGAVLGADDVGADNVGAEKVGAALGADEVGDGLGAKVVGGESGTFFVRNDVKGISLPFVAPV